MKSIPIFYKDMLISYFNFITPDSISPLRQCIWNNRHICVNQRPCFYQHFIDSGITLVSDLFDTDGTVFPFITLMRRGLPSKYNLQWQGIVSAIPLSWKLILRQGFQRHKCALQGFNICNDGVHTDISSMTSRCIYLSLVKKIFEPPTSQKKYNYELDVKDNEWSYIYTMPFKSTYDVKMRIFQYKINLNCLMTNTRLFKMNLIDSDICTFCNNHPENMKHLFWECICVNKIWKDFKTWFEGYINTNIDLNYRNIIFGFFDSGPLINLCLILIKKVIYNSRFKKRIPSLIPFKHMIKFQYKLEKKIAVNNGTLHKFMDKWNILEVFCSEDIHES